MTSKDQLLDEALAMTFPASDPVAIRVPSPAAPAEAIAFPTKSDLPEGVRETLAAALNARLADAIDLQLQCKHAHWNVKGLEFASLHALFDAVHGAVQDVADRLAERAVQLGAVAGGTLQSVAARTTLKPYPIQVGDGRAHVDLLSDALASFAASARAASDVCTAAGDADSAELFTEASRRLDEQLRLVEAHAQVARTRR